MFSGPFAAYVSYVLSLEVIFRERALWLVALLRKKTCNLRQPMHLRHPVSSVLYDVLSPRVWMLQMCRCIDHMSSIMCTSPSMCIVCIPVGTYTYQSKVMTGLCAHTPTHTYTHPHIHPPTHTPTHLPTHPYTHKRTHTLTH